MVPFRVRRDLLDPSQLEALHREILASPYLAGSDLDHGFENTQGFSVLFQRSQLERCLKLLPSARPFLQKVMDPRAQVFFMNPLVIHEGHGVGPHADKTLASFVPAQQRIPFPHRVAVLYLGVPGNLQGGELVFHRNAFARARFVPRANSLVDFPGWLYHEVKPWKQVGWDGKPPAPRVSLVCEQYRLSPKLLEHVPEFHVETTRDFQGFLDDLLS